MVCVICHGADGVTGQTWRSGGTGMDLVLCPSCARALLAKKSGGSSVPGPEGAMPGEKSRGAFASSQVRSLRLGQALVSRAFSTPGKTDARITPCPSCRSTLDSILATGFASCPACYTHFNDFLDPLIRAWHGLGKPGEAHRARVALEKALGTALEHEQYEEAARIKLLLEEQPRNLPHGY